MSTALAIDVDWNASIDNNYANPDNWSTGFRPAFFLDEVAVIGNAVLPLGFADVTIPILDEPAGVVLGQSAGQTGTLNIQGSGALTVLPGPSASGGVVVGSGGAGFLTLQSGGELVAQSLTLSGAGGSQIDVSGSSTIDIVGNVNLRGRTSVAGPSVTFETGGDLVLQSSSILNPQISGAVHSTIGVAGMASLGGTLEVAFSGPSPTAGQSWDLIDATSITGAFDIVSITGVTLQPGQGFVVETVADPSSTFGQVTRLNFEELTPALVLRVDPTTGQAELFNDSGDIAANIQGYDIFSPSGSLLPGDGDWRSLDDDDRAGGDWRESNVSVNRLAELKRSGATTIDTNAATVFDLGAPFDANGGTQDLVLQYLREGDSLPTLGAVVYEAINSGIVGDYNDDGLVDAADYAAWRNQLGVSVTLPNERPDAVTPGVVDAEDLVAWRDNFGAPVPRFGLGGCLAGARTVRMRVGGCRRMPADNR